MAPKAWLILAALLLICTPLWASEDHDEGDDP